MAQIPNHTWNLVLVALVKGDALVQGFGYPVVVSVIVVIRWSCRRRAFGD